MYRLHQYMLHNLHMFRDEGYHHYLQNKSSKEYHYNNRLSQDKLLHLTAVQCSLSDHKT